VRLSKKLAIAAVSTVATVSVATAAFAYWTTAGSGSGSASASAGSTSGTVAVTVAQIGSISGLVPGADPVSVDFRITAGSNHPYVSGVAAAITSVTSNTNAVANPTSSVCTAADFTLVQPTAVFGDLTAGNHDYVGADSGATLKLNNTNSNQDGCKGATVTLSLTAS